MIITLKSSYYPPFSPYPSRLPASKSAYLSGKFKVRRVMERRLPASKSEKNLESKALNGAEASCLHKRNGVGMEFKGGLARGIPARIIAAELSGVFAEIIFFTGLGLFVFVCWKGYASSEAELCGDFYKGGYPDGKVESR